MCDGKSYFTLSRRQRLKRVEHHLADASLVELANAGPYPVLLNTDIDRKCNICSDSDPHDRVPGGRNHKPDDRFFPVSLCLFLLTDLVLYEY